MPILRLSASSFKKFAVVAEIFILIADDHPIVRAGFKQVIADTPDMVVADEAENGLEVLNFIRKKDYDIILLDISMPGRSGSAAGRTSSGPPI